MRIAPSVPWHSEGYAVLGNHDASSLVAVLVDCGVTVLLNQAATAAFDGGRIWLVGIDDPYHYQTDDLETAWRGVKAGEFSVVLAHSPDRAKDAASLGCDYYLCGHTHGGHICLKGGWPMAYRRRYSRDLLTGSWKVGGLMGYTSRGVGSFGRQK